MWVGIQKMKRGIITAQVEVRGDLIDGKLSLRLLRDIPPGKQRAEKAASGELEFRLLVNCKSLDGCFGDGLERQ
jgi:hypothetical protein